MPPILIVSWKKDLINSFSIIDISKKITKYYEVWNGKLKLEEVIKREQFLINFVKLCKEIIIPNYKLFVDKFGTNYNCIIYDPIGEYREDQKDHLKYIINNKNELFGEWQRIRAESAKIYSKLERNGILIEHRKIYPKYEMNVFSGRSKTSGFNVQSADDSYNIRHINVTNKIFLHFDWIAVDPRICGILSEDKNILDSYKTSDPYNFMEKFYNNKVFDRNTCKLQLMRSIYALYENDETLKVFGTLSEWIKVQLKKLNDIGYVESILGRKFYLEKDKKDDLTSKRRVFNGMIQGSVVHAMQNTLQLVDKEINDIILSEQHDSLTVCVREDMVKKTIDTIVDIMFRPFQGILINNPTMPLKVHIGKSWRKYHMLREVR